jgi:hypothetical protein
MELLESDNPEFQLCLDAEDNNIGWVNVEHIPIVMYLRSEVKRLEEQLRSSQMFCSMLQSTTLDDTRRRYKRRRRRGVPALAGATPAPTPPSARTQHPLVGKKEGISTGL